MAKVNGMQVNGMRAPILVLLLMLVACGGGEPRPDLVPRIDISNATLSLTADAPIQTILVRNLGQAGSQLEWSMTSESDLVIISPAKGLVNKDEEQSVTITVDQEKIEPNTPVFEEISVVSNGGTKRIALSFRLSGTGLAACGTFPVEQFQTAGSTRYTDPVGAYAPDELLIRYATPLSSLSLDASSRKLQLERLEASVQSQYQFAVKKTASLYRPSLIKVPAGEDVLSYAKKLSQDSRIAFAEPNYYLQTLAAPSDPLYSEQWTLKNFGLEQAWDKDFGNNNVVIAVIDSGVDMTHEDLIDKMLPGCDFADDDNNPNPGLPNGGKSEHGTHVAGIAAATGNNGLGIAGVAYTTNVKILPIKVFDDRGITGKVDDLIDAILWAAGIPLEGVANNPKPADIINMSLGVDPSMIADKIASLSEALAQAKTQGVVMFAASGNAGQSDLILTPASDPNVIAIGSVDDGFGRSGFSNYASSGPTVDFMAPGGVTTGSFCNGSNEVLSTFPKTTEYGCLRGTSMASPFAAGVAALLLSQNPALSPDQVKAKLTASAYFDPESMNPEEYGNGVICADKALGTETQCGLSQ
ncbi:MAG: S8 family serine peptidase [Trueperaceae bacterium]|nr:S8 family serine peptidase [Trueperaceae bacterium]